jgi:tagatose-1,6-bisphosphate aldolase non-catalytic subunit AgaZ/GatZ
MADPAATRAAVMARCTPEQIAYSVARARPQAVSVFATPVSIPAGALDGLRRVYVHTTEDQAIRAPLQLRMIREHPCVEVVELQTDHSPAFSATADLVAALDHFAAIAIAA